ncbi:unnamed protein product [Spirodela intermedia]|uniref:RRM domain-containing protein n=1 Tax=Spirodela intermedia TaxID=51605 RepID=A0A7I8JD26_SPIIN|nr:unnamed protein product [Spirodela intermedia]CAA6668009.1 unnamed protein product [Spirodela intermedia]
MYDGCLSSLPPRLSAVASQLYLPARPTRVLNLACSSSFSSSSFSSFPSLRLLRKSSGLGPFAVQTSNWTVDGTEAGLSEWGGEEGSYAEPLEEAKLFVGNLSYDMDSEKLAQLFQQAGVVEVAEVVYNKETGRSRGFGFVNMSTVEESERAIEKFNGYSAEGRPLTVNKASPRGSRPERRVREFESRPKAYVGNLAWSVDDARLEQVFSEYGKVVDARVVCDQETGRSRGFGFVTMSTQDDAIASLDELLIVPFLQNLDGRTIRVNAAESKPRRMSF